MITVAAPMVTGELMKRLRRHYLPPDTMPGGVFAAEVGQNGSNSGQRCDALYAGFTSASGRILIGHELKVSRSDWRHELDKVGKADRWHDAVHQWYVVAPSTDIVPVEELPEGWGLMVVNPRTTTRLDIKVRSASKPAGWEPPWWAVRSFLARLDTLRAQEVREGIARLEPAVRKEAEERAVREARSAGGVVMTREQRDAVATVEAFAREGVKLAEYRYAEDEAVTPQDVAPVADVLRAGGDLAYLRERLTYPLRQIETVRKVADELLAASKALRLGPGS